MKTALTSHHSRHQDLGLLLLRTMLAVVFLWHGSQKLFGLFGGHGIDGTAVWLGSIGVPLPTLSAILAGASEFGEYGAYPRGPMKQLLRAMRPAKK